MLVHLTQSVLSQVRNAVTASENPAEVMILTEREFYELGDNEYTETPGPVIWLSKVSCIVESDKWSGKNAKYYFVRYKGNIILKLSCDVATMRRIVKDASYDTTSPAAVYIDQCYAKVIKWLRIHGKQALEYVMNTEMSTADPTMVVLKVDDVISAAISSTQLFFFLDELFNGDLEA